MRATLKLTALRAVRRQEPIERSRGFAYLLLAIILFLASAIGLTVLADYSFKTTKRQTDMTMLADVYRAITGDPAKETFGYLGDVGSYPSRLDDLIQSPGLTGWNGPYLQNVPVSGNSIYDSFGSPLECFLNLQSTEVDLAIISKGPDHTSSNLNSDPNSCAIAQFSTPYPVGSGWTNYTNYTTNPSNTDNIVYPNVASSTAAVYNPVGTLDYNLSERDTGQGGNPVTDGCALLYNLVFTSHTRPTDTITIPYNSSTITRYNLLQGIYDVTITSPTVQGPVFSESPSVFPGRVNGRQVRVSDVNSTKTPQHTITVVNNTGVTLTIQMNGANNGGTVATGTSASYTKIGDCASMKAINGSTTYDSWIAPWGIASTHAIATGANIFTATITNNGTHSSNELIVLQDSLPIGTVYLYSTVTFNVPKGATIVVEQQNGTVLATYSSITGNITY